MVQPPTDEQQAGTVEELKVNGVEEPKEPQDPPPKTNGLPDSPSVDPKRGRAESDPDAQGMLVGSLRNQIQDLFSQVTELNGKLVKSYDRVSDLEDDLHSASSTIRASTLKISQLEMERTQHLSALNTGLLVEKSHVTTELNRLMERATEEAAQRGQAETARADIEKELDDLSANLFDQANNMVAEARFARHTSEQKLAEAELALKGAEEAVSLMQQQMQTLQAEREKSDEKAQKALALIGKGKWVEKPEEERNITQAVRLLSSHAPYQEFLLFVAHLRSLHPSTPHPPAMTTLLPLPFLARLLTEDSEPTIRLDLAPSLNWLSRRSVLAAIHSGQLIVEPMSSTAFLHEILSSATSTTIPGLSSGGNQSVLCALCGSDIFPPIPEAESGNPTPTSATNSWATGLFKRSTSNPTATNRSRLPSINSDQYPTQVYVFRLASSSPTSAAVPAPPPQRNHGRDPSSSFAPQHSNNTSQILSSPTSIQSATIYPLCHGKWCLNRLRITCTIWAFVRSGIIDKIWEEEVALPPPPPKIATSLSDEKPPPVPPRRRGLWGALTERAASWGGDGDKNKAESNKHVPPATRKSAEEKKSLPPPPPSHPSVPRVHATADSSAPTQVHRVPPALPKRNEVPPQPSPIPPATTPEPTLEEDKPTPADANNAVPATSTDPVLQEEKPTSPPAVPSRPPRRPMAPANIPLPASRPQTPLAGGVAESPSSPKFPPAAGAAPPPLPRRAAGRASRVPHFEGAGPRPGSRPGTPAAPSSPPAAKVSEAATVVKVESPLPTQKEDEQAERHNASQSAVKPGENSEAVSKEDPVPSLPDGTENKSPDINVGGAVTFPVVSTPTSEDDFVDAPSDLPAQAVGGLLSANTPDQPKGAVKENTSVDGDATTTQEHPNQDGTTPQQTDKVLGGPDPKVLHEAPEPIEQETSEAPKDQKDKSDGDKEVYIGDATWEERTWKEIVRLKEAMFWARVGGLRS